MTCVQDVMTRDVTVIEAGSDVHELEKLLLRERIHGVPVVDADGRLVGVVTQTDLLNWHFASGVDGAGYFDRSTLRAAVSESRRLAVTDVQAARIDEVMSARVFCIAPDRPIAEAAAMMIRRWVHRLVVVDDELHVIGVVSSMDLLHCLPGAQEALRRAESDDPAQTA